MRTSRAVGAFLLVISGAFAWEWLSHPLRTFGSGDELTRRLVAMSEINETIPLPLPDTFETCVGPGDGFGRADAKMLMPNTEVVFEDSDRSEGVWNVFLKNSRGQLEIYDIDRRSIAWPTRGDAPRNSYIKCPSSITIRKLNGRLTVAGFGA